MIALPGSKYSKKEKKTRKTSNTLIIFRSKNTAPQKETTTNQTKPNKYSVVRIDGFGQPLLKTAHQSPKHIQIKINFTIRLIKDKKKEAATEAPKS